jgi:hypothetical protein
MGLLDRPGQQPQRFGLLSPDVMSLIQNAGTRVPVPAAQPQAPRRERVSGWRVFDRVLGGQTVTEGLDAERARLEAQANAPQMEAQRQQILASIQDPRERALFLASPEDWAKNVGQQFAPQVIAAGSGQAIGGRLGVEMPSYTESGDQILRRTSQGIEPAYTRTAPSITERIALTNADSARITANRPIELAPGVRALRPDGTEFGRGAPRILAAPDGTDLVDENGNPVYENERDAPPVDPEAQARAEQAAAARLAMADNLATGLTGARRFVGTAGVWSRFNPLNQQNRANLEAHLDTLKGNITFERLSEMKANSPNGASGLGALSDNEARMLASTVAALNPDMSPQELERSFGIIDQLVAKMRQDGAPSAPPSGQPVRITNDADYARLPSGATFVGPDGVTRRKP